VSVPDPVMLRALIVATLVVVVPHGASGQALGVLHVKVTLVDAEQRPAPVPRHALLVSDNPPSASPRLAVTALDGTVAIALRPGRYTVESDRPVALNGQAYKWTQMIEITAGGDVTLELTAGNADVTPAAPESAPSGASVEDTPFFLLPRWQDSVVALWTPTSRASGFVVDARGLVATSRRAIGDAKAVDVQLSPSVKVAARALVADPARDVAVLWIDPTLAGSVRPVPLECTPPAMSPLVDGQEIFTIGAPLRGPKDLASGTVSIAPDGPLADFGLETGSVGGPVFAAGGGVVGLTSVADETDETRRGDARVVRAGDVCDALASAAKEMEGTAPPSGTHLPVEPARPFPLDALENGKERHAGSLTPYQVSSSDFEVTFITPGLAYAAQQQSGRGRTGGALSPEAAEARERLLTDFGRWSEYVADVRPVLLIRVTPKLTEGFWTRVARGAVWTQGVSLPPIKRFRPGFSRMRAFCGSTEVPPIHPFTLETRVSERDAIREGLYVFDPDALGPQCGTVELVLYSEKEPTRGDSRVVDPKVVEHIWQDFAPYRAL
jgi:S1-C subfamily serine protease